MAPKNIKIVGTAHVSKESIEEVKETIITNQPDVVAVELDMIRYQNMLAEKNGQEKPEVSIRNIIKEDKLSIFLVSMLLSYLQKKIGEDLGVKPGSEMISAIETAEKIGAKVALIDRDISVTLKRALNKMSFIEKVKFVFGILTSFFSKDKIEDVESIKNSTTLTEVMEYFKEVSPKLYSVIVSERDAYMANMLQNIEGESVVVIVGAGHKKGIKKYMTHPGKIPPIE